MTSGSDTAAAMIAALAGLEAGLSLDDAAARRLAEMTAEEAAQALAALIARSGDEPAERQVVDACCRALVFGTPALSEERRGAIRAAAHGLGLGAVSALLTAASPALAPEPEFRPIDPALASLTLGHRKQFARTERNPERLARFAADGDASVIRNLLVNPRITEALVVRIAARRPIAAVVLEEIARSPRWSSRREVRRALALNPYAPPTLVNPLLPRLGATDLEEVAASDVLHPAVRAAARSLLDARRA